MESENSIQCSSHGDATATYVCEHLASNPKQRWYCAYPTEENRWPDAWCGHCDLEFRKEGGWNEKNENAVKIKMMCSQCYESAHASSVNCVEENVVESWRQTIAECHQELCAKQELLSEQFHLSKHKRWDYDQETGLLVFSNDNVPAVISDIEMIGSVSTSSETWLWSWANFSLLPNVKSRISAVRDFGDHNEFLRLIVPKWRADETDGWEMSAIAVHVLNAKGVYRVPTDTGFLFMAITDIRFAV